MCPYVCVGWRNCAVVVSSTSLSPPCHQPSPPPSSHLKASKLPLCSPHLTSASFEFAQTSDWTQQDPKMSLAAGARPAALFVQAIMANCTERSFIMCEILIVLKEFFFLLLLFQIRGRQTGCSAETEPQIISPSFICSHPYLLKLKKKTTAGLVTYGSTAENFSF